MPSASVPVSSSISVAKRAAIELPSTSRSHQRSMLKTTSSAVNASPLAQVTPCRTFSTYSVASSLTSQLSSSMGSNVKSAVYLTSGSRNWRATLPISDQSKVRGSFGSRTVIDTSSVPPLTPSCAAAGAGAASPSSP